MRKFLLLFLLLVAACGGPQTPEQGIYSALDELGIPRHEAQFKFDTLTPKGVQVVSTVPVPPNALSDIDAGIDKQLECVAPLHPSWGEADTHADYRVYFVDPRGHHPTQGWPEIHVQGIPAAGTAIGNVRSGWPKRWLVLPHHGTVNWGMGEYLQHSIRHESEHIRASQNDREVFERFVGPGYDVHPNFPCPGDWNYPSTNSGAEVQP